MNDIIKDFKNLKESGQISVAKIGNAFAVSSRRYDPLTGEEVDSNVVAFDQKMLLKLRADAADLKDNIDFALAEVEKLK